jgi:hypothetical protein
MNEHEFGFTAFLAAPTQRRVLTLLELGPKRRRDLRELLDHDVALNLRHARHLRGDKASAVSVVEDLRKHAAPETCYVISADEDLDGREMPLSEAVGAIVGSSFGGFVSCIPGKLGYFEYEEARSAYLLHR